MFFLKKKIKTFAVFNYYFYICTRNLISAQETQSASYEALFCVFSSILSTIRFFFYNVFSAYFKTFFYYILIFALYRFNASINCTPIYINIQQ